MCRKLIYFICIIFVLAASSGVRAQVFIDDFNTPHDYLTNGVEGTIWDDFFGLLPGETVTALNASIDRPGQLFISSQNGVWDTPWNPLGPFLYKVVNGDFIATVKVSDYSGTPTATVAHNDGGLMVRAFLDDAGPGEDWVTIDYFPIWTGNMIWEARDGVRNDAWSCSYPGFTANRWDVVRPYLRLERIGNTFHFSISSDGQNWQEMSCSPKTRNDFDGLPLMVGLRHATYSATLGYVGFDDFRLEVIVRLKAYNPVPADKAGNVAVSMLAWKPGDTATRHDVYFGINEADVRNADTSDTMGIYRGRQDPNTYMPEALTPGQTYYWRIDEVEADGVTLHTGDIWSFSPISLIAWNPSVQTSQYVFLSNQSTLVQTGGIAGVHWTYRIEGKFLLTIDPNAGAASFSQVDANAIDDSPYQRTLDPNEVFAMTTLLGTVLNNTTISFTGKTTNGSNVNITATLQNEPVHLVGQTTPPPDSADFFLFSLDAVAQRKYSGGTDEFRSYDLTLCVRDVEHVPIPGVNIRAYSKQWFISRHKTAGADGCCTLNLPRGE